LGKANLDSRGKRREIDNKLLGKNQFKPPSLMATKEALIRVTTLGGGTKEKNCREKYERKQTGPKADRGGKRTETGEWEGERLDKEDPHRDSTHTFKLGGRGTLQQGGER